MDSFKYYCRKTSTQMQICPVGSRGTITALLGISLWDPQPIKEFCCLFLFWLATNFPRLMLVVPFKWYHLFTWKKTPWGKAHNVASSSAFGFSEPLVNLTNLCWQWGWTMREMFSNSNLSRASRTWNSCKSADMWKINKYGSKHT